MKLIIITVFTFVFFLTGMSEAGLLDGLVAYYKFDGNADDMSVYENDGTISGGVIFAKGIFNQAACFNGTDGYVEAPHHSALSLEQWSISVWVYPSAMPDDTVLVGRDDDLNLKYNYALLQRSTNFDGQYETASSEFDHEVTARDIITDMWYHVVSTRSTNGEHKIYLDGVLVDSETWNDTPVQNTGKLIIARYVDSYPLSDRFFTGCLDDARVYNRALSKTEVKDLYNLRK
jgi:hypothetical protein